MREIIFVGEQRSSKPGDPLLDSSSGRRLRDLMQGRPYRGINLLTYRGIWSPRDAADAAQELRNHEFGPLVLLGRKVEAAFDLKPGVWLTWRGRLGIMPHPSGRNRWYNDPLNIEAAREFLRNPPPG